MSFMRLIATKVLFVLLASWVLTVLQPCCEAIASTLPHDHGLTQKPLHSDHEHDTIGNGKLTNHPDHEHATTDSGKLTDHQHCETNDNDIGNIPWLVNENILAGKSESKSDFVTATHVFPEQYTFKSLTELSFTYYPPPPSRHHRLYLKTQRLRI